MKLLLVAIAFIAAIQQGEGNNADGWVTKDTPTCELVTWFEDAMNKAEEMECHLELQEGFPEIGLNVSSARLLHGSFKRPLFLSGPSLPHVSLCHIKEIHRERGSREFPRVQRNGGQRNEGRSWN